MAFPWRTITAVFAWYARLATDKKMINAASFSSAF
jgi:hypothetical protein